jgi:hypothetical protein
VHTHGRKVCTTAAGKQRDIERGASIVTTINAAAAMHVSMRGTIAALGILVAGGLVGCSSSGGGGDLLQQNSPLVTSNALQASKTTSRARIAIAPVIGAPDSVAKQVTTQLGLFASKNNIAIARTPGDKVDYTLRGYIVAAREARATKVSYIWDITNPIGARVHRITGEEVATGSGVGDPWASVSPQLIQTIASKTGTQLTAWLPQKAQLAPTKRTSTPIAGQARPAGSLRVAKAVPGTTPIATSGIRPQPTASAAAKGINTPVTALVPQVVGAPGDGANSLASALRNELLRNGVRPTLPGVRSSYRVEGRVKIGRAVGGQQPIKIDWVVRDPKGVNLGTVSQENKIPAGSLNGKWGSTANAAATAATQGIRKLLPKQVASR